MKIIQRKDANGKPVREYVAETEAERRELQRRAEAGQLTALDGLHPDPEDDPLGPDDFEDAPG